MKIGLIDVDGHHFPNLALMKLSAYHKGKALILRITEHVAALRRIFQKRKRRYNFRGKIV